MYVILLEIDYFIILIALIIGTIWAVIKSMNNEDDDQDEDDGFLNWYNFDDDKPIKPRSGNRVY